MSKTRNNRISLQILKADEEAFFGLRSIEDYKPANPAYSLEAVTAIYERYRRAIEAEIVANNAAAEARDEVTLAGKELHLTMIEVKTQVKAVYGEDSNQIAAMGLKKKSDRKLPSREKAAKDAQA